MVMAVSGSPVLDRADFIIQKAQRNAFKGGFVLFIAIVYLSFCLLPVLTRYLDKFQNFIKVEHGVGLIRSVDLCGPLCYRIIVFYYDKGGDGEFVYYLPFSSEHFYKFYITSKEIFYEFNSFFERLKIFVFSMPSYEGGMHWETRTMPAREDQEKAELPTRQALLEYIEFESPTGSDSPFGDVPRWLSWLLPYENGQVTIQYFNYGLPWLYFPVSVHVWFLSNLFIIQIILFYFSFKLLKLPIQVAVERYSYLRRQNV
jgi:hypothetical protein